MKVTLNEIKKNLQRINSGADVAENQNNVSTKNSAHDV